MYEVVYALNGDPNAKEYSAIGTLPAPLNKQAGENYVFTNVTLFPGGAKRKALWIPKHNVIHVSAMEDAKTEEATQGSASIPTDVTESVAPDGGETPKP